MSSHDDWYRKCRAIAELNDAFRATLNPERDKVYLDHDVKALPAEVLRELIHAVQNFNDFTPDYDLHGRHESGCIEFHGELYRWSIQDEDLDGHWGSPDPTDPTKTIRVMMIMSEADYKRFLQIV